MKEKNSNSATQKWQNRGGKAPTKNENGKNEPFRAVSKLNGAKTGGFRRSEKLNEGIFSI